MMIIISIGNVVGWLASIYVKNALPGLLGHVVISTTGAFIGGYLSLRIFSESDKFSMIISAFIGAALLLFIVRFRNWRS
ncbi:MAG: GlsB/YeaQ/YmgE family stress response membrane protein [Rhodospirillales bacterium]|nr:GlsB/YeaQ/YmgE family stress response membrane protein [Rhodospirillales bacterium]